MEENIMDQEINDILHEIKGAENYSNFLHKLRKRYLRIRSLKGIDEKVRGLYRTHCEIISLARSYYTVRVPGTEFEVLLRKNDICMLGFKPEGRSCILLSGDDIGRVREYLMKYRGVNEDSVVTLPIGRSYDHLHICPKNVVLGRTSIKEAIRALTEYAMHPYPMTLDDARETIAPHIAVIMIMIAESSRNSRIAEQIIQNYETEYKLSKDFVAQLDEWPRVSEVICSYLYEHVEAREFRWHNKVIPLEVLIKWFPLIKGYQEEHYQ